MTYVDIEGVNLPGRRCGPNPQGEMYENVHVGVGLRQDPTGLIPGDAESARWRIEVRTSLATDGSVDFHGPFVEGKRGDRWLYLNWGTVATDGSFRLFRRAKLSLSKVEPSLVDRALRENGSLACTVNLTDAKGQPRCARVRPPDIAWRMIPGDPFLRSSLVGA
ncbi:MAG TPA: DUF5990 family protein, partial [Chloroflexota bacterium]|nr:DUF5990 family protein [Chloroflexota bacterium]